MEEPKKILKIVIFSFSFLILIFFLFIIFKGKKTKELPKEEKNYSQTIRVSPTPTSSIFAKAEEAIVFLKKIDEFTYQILASSYNHDIVGFDFIVECENLVAFDDLTASSLLPSFSLYPTKKENFLILTGVKKLNFQQPTVFNQTPVVELKSKNPIKINLKVSFGKYTSKLVDNQNNILKPKIVLK